MVDRTRHDERVRALRDALAALDGHHLRDGSGRGLVRHLLACGECGHQPEQHESDGAGPCTADPCPCAEWELPDAEIDREARRAD